MNASIRRLDDEEQGERHYNGAVTQSFTSGAGRLGGGARARKKNIHDIISRRITNENLASQRILKTSANERKKKNDRLMKDTTENRLRSLPFAWQVAVRRTMGDDIMWAVGR